MFRNLFETACTIHYKKYLSRKFLCLLNIHQKIYNQHEIKKNKKAEGKCASYYRCLNCQICWQAYYKNGKRKIGKIIADPWSLHYLK